MADKKRERAIIECARRVHPWFPPGDIVEDERPDFRLVDGDDEIGIEVTQLFQPPRDGSRFPPHEIAQFHRRIMQIAEQQAVTLPPLDVAVYFDYREPLSNAHKVAASLVDFVQTHPVERCETFDNLVVPPGFSVIRIAQPWANEVPRWRVWDSGETLLITPEVLRATIAGKNSLVSDYRASVDRVWLLIAATFFPLASTYAVPNDIKSWRFEFDFDKVLMMSDESGVFDLQRLAA